MISQYYFGKLRRRREFLKSPNITREVLLAWEGWFSRCANNRSFLPFLDNKSSQKCIWLCLVIEDDFTLIGLTSASRDLSGRDYPFVIYTTLKAEDLSSEDTLLSSLKYMAIRSQKFANIIANGYFEPEDEEYYHADYDCELLNQDTLTALHHIANHISKDNSDIDSRSYWLDLSSLKSIYNESSFTCSLYNKVYG